MFFQENPFSFVPITYPLIASDLNEQITPPREILQLLDKQTTIEAKLNIDRPQTPPDDYGVVPMNSMDDSEYVGLPIHVIELLKNFNLFNLIFFLI